MWQVTIFGQSAGSIAVANLFLNSNLESLVRAAVRGLQCLITHTISSRLFKIFESGAQSSLPMFPGAHRDQDWQNFVAAVPQCAGASSTYTFDCLRQADITAIVSGQSSASGQAGEQFPWMPVIDGTGGVIPDLPSTLLAAGQFSRLPFISGSNLDEGASYHFVFEPFTYMLYRHSVRVDEPIVG